MQDSDTSKYSVEIFWDPQQIWSFWTLWTGMICFRFRHYKLGYDISIYYFKFHITLDLVDSMMNDGHGAKMSNVVLT